MRFIRFPRRLQFTLRGAFLLQTISCFLLGAFVWVDVAFFRPALAQASSLASWDFLRRCFKTSETVPVACGSFETNF